VKTSYESSFIKFTRQFFGKKEHEESQYEAENRTEYKREPPGTNPGWVISC